jgi:outer membrane lipoprotein SlyB
MVVYEVAVDRSLPLQTFLILFLSACSPSYSPDTYAANAAQQANKTEQGVIVGVRPVAITAAGTVGTVAGGAAGGIAGAQMGVGPISAFSALGGSLIGGLAGSAAEHATSDTKAFEYIVRKANAELVSVTQKDKVPLVLEQKVLVISGTQARVVPDYTIAQAAPTAAPSVAEKTTTMASNKSATQVASGPSPAAVVDKATPVAAATPTQVAAATPTQVAVATPTQIAVATPAQVAAAQIATATSSATTLEPKPKPAIAPTPGAPPTIAQSAVSPSAANPQQ